MFAATYDCGQGKSLTTYLTTYSRCGNLLSFTEGLRKLPGCKRDGNSTGYLKVKLKGDGLRAVYRLERTEKTMLVVVVSTRDDNTV